MRNKIDKSQFKIINIMLPIDLHQRFKSIVAKKSLDMQKKTLYLIAEFVNKEEIEEQRQEDNDEDF